MNKPEIIPAEKMLSNKLLLIPLIGHPVFPGIFTPLMISDPEDVKSVEEVYNGNGLIGIVMEKNEVDCPSVKDLYTVGTAARIVKKINLPDGGINIFVSTLKRFKIKKVINEQNPMEVIVEYLEDDNRGSKIEIRALTRTIISEMKEIAENNPLFSEEMRLNMVNIDHPGKIADFIASILNVEKKDQQRILETLNVRKRMENVLIFIKKEQELLRIQKRIQSDLNEKIEKNQREYFLKEELKSIKEELGEITDAKSSDYAKFSEKIKNFNFTGEIAEAVESELEKFKLMDPNSSEYIVSRNYLETIVNLPWLPKEAEPYSITDAKKILEDDHYGLEDVKKRILEYIAVRKVKGDNKGSVILLVGPPGVGKTSVGKSIAKSMKKPFFRFSVGGLRDEAEIKGHRRTYVGALPGKIIQGLKIVKTNDPVFLIDEVDKMGFSHQGDPTSALLEVLDPEQNVNFRDQYLDLPFDISNVLFILTANTLDGVPDPLLDRAEIIKLSGYIDQEKIEIAKNYLIPKSLEKNGLKKNQVKYEKNALNLIVTSYARESGVRNLEKCFDKIHRKYCTELLSRCEKESDNEILKESIKIGEVEVEKYLSKPVFCEDEILKADKPGTALGLAWTSMGGDVLLIESLSTAGKGGLQVTGRLGEVMKESANIAMTWTKKYCLKNEIKDTKWFNENTIHLHFPEGATPKDGPSAGITITTALISLLKGKTVKKNIAMTGELSLTGKVLPIGGLKEKTVAAKRNKIKGIIIPQANKRDLDEIPDIVKKGITFYPVNHIDQVIDLIF
ncbi:MAG: endopeptidase La [Treponemataceae bacterium]